MSPTLTPTPIAQESQVQAKASRPGRFLWPLCPTHPPSHGDGCPALPCQSRAHLLRCPLTPLLPYSSPISDHVHCRLHAAMPTHGHTCHGTANSRLAGSVMRPDSGPDPGPDHAPRRVMELVAALGAGDVERQARLIANMTRCVYPLPQAVGAWPWGHGHGGVAHGGMAHG